MARPSNTAERRTQIARALLKVMARSGYEGASVADVAKVAKIAPGLVHYHFKNKLEILLAATDELAQDYAERLDRHLEAAGGDPERELRAFVDAHLRAGAEADPEALACWIDISGESLREPRVKKAFARVMAGSVSRLRDILERGTAQDLFSCKEPEVAAAAIVATIQGYFVLAANAREIIPPGSAARAAMAMCQGLVGGARSTSTPRARKGR
jgi:TetR/AcrR family transcriptional regulator, transcriptional repressor of bet genes